MAARAWAPRPFAPSSPHRFKSQSRFPCRRGAARGGAPSRASRRSSAERGCARTARQRRHHAASGPAAAISPAAAHPSPPRSTAARGRDPQRPPPPSSSTAETPERTAPLPAPSRRLGLGARSLTHRSPSSRRLPRAPRSTHRIPARSEARGRERGDSSTWLRLSKRGCGADSGPPLLRSPAAREWPVRTSIGSSWPIGSLARRERGKGGKGLGEGKERTANGYGTRRSLASRARYRGP